MKNWREKISEELRPGFEAHVMAQASRELQALKEKKRSWYRGSWFLSFTSGVVAAMLVIFVITPRFAERNIPADDVAWMTMDPEILENMDLFLELDEIEDLEGLEQWQGS